MTKPLRIFIDANVLAAPLTRTLLLSAAGLSGYSYTWSAQAEAEANRNMRRLATRVETVRALHLDNMTLSATADLAGRFINTHGEDRQILADAEASGSQFIITNNVDDFDPDDLDAADLAAATADLFMSQRISIEGYQHALTIIARGQKNPPITAEDLHRNLSKVHPRLFDAQNDAYGLKPLLPRHNRPAVEYRGARCIQCEQRAPTNPAGMYEGLCPTCYRGADSHHLR